MEVIAWLLQPKPEMRATVRDMDRDPWVWQSVNIDRYSWSEVLPNAGNLWIFTPFTLEFRKGRQQQKRIRQHTLKHKEKVH